VTTRGPALVGPLVFWSALDERGPGRAGWRRGRPVPARSSAASPQGGGGSGRSPCRPAACSAFAAPRRAASRALPRLGVGPSARSRSRPAWARCLGGRLARLRLRVTGLASSLAHAWRAGSAGRRDVVPAAVHPAPAAQRVVEAQPREGPRRSGRPAGMRGARCGGAAASSAPTGAAGCGTG